MMAKKFKRVMSLVMVFVLCLSMMNLTVLATEGFTPVHSDSTVQIEGEDLPLYHVHNSTATTEDPLVANRTTDPEVYASKTIYPTADENYFEIELMVETSEKITEIKTGTDSAVSLVIDISGSMDDPMSDLCKNCGEERDNKQHGKGHACEEGWATETKMDAAVAAAKAFVDSYKVAGGESEGKRWMSLVTYAYDGIAIELGGETWVDVSTAAGYNAVMAALNTFDSYYGNGGTDVADGLAKVSELLEDETIIDLEHKYVVLLGDGMPDSSYGYHAAPSGNYAKYSSYNSNGYVNAEKWARKIRTTQETTLFSVYVEQGGTSSSTGYKWFDTFSNRTVLAANTQTLVDTFEDYVAIISFGIEAWSVTDPMGTNIEFTGKVSGQNNYDVIGNTLTWNLINDIPEIYDADGNAVAAADMVESEAYTFVYTFRYGVRLNNDANGFAEETFYNANGRTYLQYYLLDEDGDPIGLDGQLTNSLLTLDFVVPAVKGYLGEFSFVKENADGEPLSGAQFSLTHDGRACAVCDGASVGTLAAASDENGLVSFTGIPSGHSYTLTETVAPAGYALSEDAYKVIVSYGEVTISLNGQTVEDGFSFVNEPLPAYGPLTITKTFAGDDVDAPANLTFVVIDASGTEVAVARYADFVDGSYTIPSLVEGTYTVTESGAEVDGYILTASSASETAEIVDETGAEVSFTNTYERIPEPGTLTITKEFVDLPEESYPASLTFTVSGPAGYQGETSVTLNAENDWSYTIDNAPVGAYTVTEVGGGVDGYSLISTTYNGAAAGSVEVTELADVTVAVVNTYEEIEKFGALTITKTFGADSVLDADNWPENGKLTFVIENTEGGEYTLTLPTASGEWTDGFAQLPLGTYTITETDNIDGYSFSKQFTVGGETVTSFEVTEAGVELEVVNHYTKDTVYGTLTIVKEFAGETVDVPANLTFVVTDASGDEVASVNYADFVNGSYTVTALPVGDYTVSETGANVTGYDLTASVENDGLVNVTENGGSVTFVNSYAETQKYGDLTITKTFSGVDALPGTLTFLVKDSSDNEIASVAYSSFVNGSYTVTGLPVGDYIVSETGANVTGYDLTATVENDGLVTVVESGASIAFENVYSRNTSTVPGSASITIEKVDENGELITKAATFGLFKGDKRVATARTANGVATFTFGNSGIAAGEYTLKEVSAPRGYLRTEETWSVVATSDASVSDTANAIVTTWTWTAAVNGNTSIKVVNVEDKSDVVLDKSASAATPAPGDIFTYTLKVTNIGTQDATEVTVVDNLPAEVYYWDEIISAQFEFDDANKRVTWTPGKLAVGETKEISFQVKLLLTVTDGTVVTNEAYTVWDEDPTTFHKDIEEITVVEPTPEPIPTPTPEPTPTPTPDPTPDPVEPEPFIPPYVPPVEPPVEDEEPIEIEEPEVPLIDEPPVEDEEPIEIEEPEVPLADVPKTGDPLLTLLAVLGASGAGLTGLTLRGKRKEEDEE